MALSICCCNTGSLKKLFQGRLAMLPVSCVATFLNFAGSSGCGVVMSFDTLQAPSPTNKMREAIFMIFINIVDLKSHNGIDLYYFFSTDPFLHRLKDYKKHRNKG